MDSIPNYHTHTERQLSVVVPYCYLFLMSVLIWTHWSPTSTDTVAERLGKQRRKRKSWVTPAILDICDQRRDLKKKRGEPEGDKDYRKIKRKIKTEMKMTKETWIQGQFQEVEACLKKNNSKKVYHLVKNMTAEKQGTSSTIQDKSGKCLTEENEILKISPSRRRSHDRRPDLSLNTIWKPGKWPTIWTQSLIITLTQKGNFLLWFLTVTCS